MVFGMLDVFQPHVYTLLDPGDSLFALTPYVAMRFSLLVDVCYNVFRSLLFLVIAGDCCY